MIILPILASMEISAAPWSHFTCKLHAAERACQRARRTPPRRSDAELPPGQRSSPTTLSHYTATKRSSDLSGGSAPRSQCWEFPFKVTCPLGLEPLGISLAVIIMTPWLWDR